MAILCLICKEKLLLYGTEASVTSENIIIATSCGHLYHAECLTSWFRTQKLKKSNSEHEANFCPTCNSAVDEKDNRRIFPVEDHREALETAKLVEKHENLEIYCHQLGIRLQQLERENDTLVHKILTPSSCSVLDSYDTIVKNDRVVWIRGEEPPASGIVLSIFKKNGTISAKLKLDKKIRTTQRTSKLFSSFRLDKKQEVTVPFEEIVLEKDFKLQAPLEYSRISSSSPDQLSTPKRPISYPSRSISSTAVYQQDFSVLGSTSSIVRSSTYSLPGSRKTATYGYMGSVHKNSPSTDKINHDTNQIVVNHLQSKNLNRSISYTEGVFREASRLSTYPWELPEPIIETPTETEEIEDVNNNIAEYVLIAARSNKDASSNGVEPEKLLKSSPPDNIRKHVTFADDSSKAIEKNGVAGKPERNLILPNYEDAILRKMSDSEASSSATPTRSPHFPDFYIPPQPENMSTQSASECKATSIPDLSFNVGEVSEEYARRSCFDMTLLALLYNSVGFDNFFTSLSENESKISQDIKELLRINFINPVRMGLPLDFSYCMELQEILEHLLTGTVDPEEFLTVLFELTFKLPTFINYSYMMTDYLHQFFIDFTDTSKMKTVQASLEKSLEIQDNLKLEGAPSPALILQMPFGSEDQIIHYNAIIPNLKINIAHLLDPSRARKKCYCNKDATLGCKTCANIHGSSTLYFCNICKGLLEAIHLNDNHELEIVPISVNPKPEPEEMMLTSIICFKNNSYSVFLKQDFDLHGSWVYVHSITSTGELRKKELPGFSYWLKNLESEPETIDFDALAPLLQLVLKNSRLFLYRPIVTTDI